MGTSTIPFPEPESRRLVQGGFRRRSEYIPEPGTEQTLNALSVGCRRMRRIQRKARIGGP